MLITSARWALIIIFAFMLACCSMALMAAPHKRHVSVGGCREQTMNETLTMTLVVGSDFRNQGKHPTWQEISDEVARRMKLKKKPLP